MQLRFRLLLAAPLCATVVGCGSKSKETLESLRAAVQPPPPPPDTIPEVLDYAADLQVDLSDMAKLPIGVLYRDLAPGEGPEAGAGDSVEVSFQAWLPDGTRVDSAITALRIGAGDVPSGIDAALEGMKPGGRRKVVLSPGLAFGAEGRENIPPYAVLVYDLELRAKRP